MSFIPGTWNHIELRNINFTAYNYDLYVNGSLAAADVTFYWHASNMKFFDLMLYDSDAVVCWDDIQVE